MPLLTTSPKQRATIMTLGCKVNAYESALMGQKLRADRWTLVSPKEPVDLFVINSCTVTAEAGRQTRQEIRRAVRRNPDALVVVTGCYAEMEDAVCNAIPGVDLVMGNAEKLSIADRVREHRAGVNVPSATGKSGLLKDSAGELFSGPNHRTRALVQVQQGCDQSCTFCIIHKARGPSQSFSLDYVERQIETLIGKDYHEFVICGVDLGSWGADLKSRHPTIRQDIVTLLQRVSSLAGDYRIRLSSIDPIHLTDELVELISSSDRFCPHFHISLQSANPLILKRMKRRYNKELLYQRIEAARCRIPGLVLSADILVGFPTESETQFEDTLCAINNLEIAYPHVFMYSARAGTPASRIPSQAPIEIRKERSGRVRNASNRVRQQLLLEQVGQQGKVLVERIEIRGANRSHGRLANYIPVQLEKRGLVRGQFMNVVITDTKNDVLIARAKTHE